MKNRVQVLQLLDTSLKKLSEVKPRDTASANRLREGKEKTRAARAKVAEEPEDVLPFPSQIYIGAWINEARLSHSTVPWNGAYWTTFEELSGRKMAVIHFGMGWGQWYRSTLGLCGAKGEVPCVDVDPPGSLQEILEGKQDAALAQMYEEIMGYGRPMMIRPIREMNGTWYRWGRDPNYVAAWRYMHDRMEAPNLSWVWCPNTFWDAASREALVGAYPGDDYVDWTGLDGYNWGPNPYQPDRWKTPAEIIGPTYDILLEVAPSKPILIGEMASGEDGGSKAQWITELLHALHGFPAIRCLLWFNWEIFQSGGYLRWPVTSSPEAQAAWKAGLTDPYFGAIPNAQEVGRKVLVP